jgi:proteasome lid subunit RPN8/RPN11
MNTTPPPPKSGRQAKEPAQDRHEQPLIRFGEVYAATPLEERLPGEEFLIQPAQGRRLRQQARQVYIAVEILDGIRRDLAQTPRVERGGILIGHAFRDLDDRRTSFTVVIGAISQPSEDSSVGHYTVTPAMITQARRTLERHFPGGAVVGWYHSHPGHGIFLSEQDMRIVRSLYSAPWQIAFVRDTIRNLEGVFYGPNGDRLDGWLEMKTTRPDFIQAADLYGRLRDAPPDEQPALLAELRDLVRRSPFLEHWRRRERYQGMPLDAPPTPRTPAAAPPAAVQEIDLIDQIALFEPSPLPPHAAEPLPALPPRDAEVQPVAPPLPPPAGQAESIEKALRRYHHAIDLAQSGNIGSGLRTLRDLARSHPDLPHIDEWVRYWELVDRSSRARRPGRPEEP